MSDRDCPFNQSLICPYFGIMLPRGIEIMVIGRQATETTSQRPFVAKPFAKRLRFLQTTRLFRSQHSKRGAYLHAHPSDLPDHSQNTLESALPPSEISPSSPHTKSRTPIFFSLAGCLEDRLDINKRGRLGRRRVSRGLRTVGA